MQIRETEIPGVRLIEAEPASDPRGTPCYPVRRDWAVLPRGPDRDR